MKLITAVNYKPLYKEQRENRMVFAIPLNVHSLNKL